MAHQLFATRARTARSSEVEAVVRRLSAVQLDSITAVERSHRIAIGSRVGNYPRGTISELLAEGRIFEYWAHEACLLPIEVYPLFRVRMAVGGRWGSYVRALREHADLVPKVLAEIHERGPLGAKHFGGAGGGMWNWKPAKRVLEALWDRGQLAIAGRPGFHRLYDLSERVIPEEHLNGPVPDEEEYLRGLVLLAVRGRGALTNYGIREHWRLKGGAGLIQPALEALCRQGAIREVALSDGGASVYVPAEAELDGGRPRGGVLLSPFDNLLWDRPFTERIFGFRHVIEVYKREHERIYGYYVLPFLLGDRLVGRADLKAERKQGVLHLRSFHREAGVRRSQRLDEALGRALARLARTLGLEGVKR